MSVVHSWSYWINTIDFHFVLLCIFFYLCICRCSQSIYRLKLFSPFVFKLPPPTAIHGIPWTRHIHNSHMKLYLRVSTNCFICFSMHYSIILRFEYIIIISPGIWHAHIYPILLASTLSRSHPLTHSHMHTRYHFFFFILFIFVAFVWVACHKDHY